jgi:hypothetical protein
MRHTQLQIANPQNKLPSPAPRELPCPSRFVNAVIFLSISAWHVFSIVNFTIAEETPTPLRQAHAHNDYLHTRPLLDALDQVFGSVEADIFLQDGQLLIGHEAKDLQPQRTLESLYLQPLRDRIKAHHDNVYGKDFPFYLLIDVKTSANETYEVLDQTLHRYADMLSVWRNDRFEPKAVTVILSGNRAREMIVKQKVRYVGIDGRPEDLDTDATASLVPWISARWGQLFKWNGDGPLPADERDKLIDLVTRAHKRGQQVRFWATPEKETVWKELLEQHVDLINTDDLAGLRQFLLSQSNQ